MRALLLLLACAGGACAADAPAYDSAFAGYQAYREPTVKLAGRDTVKPPAKPANPHAGHAMHGAAPAAKDDPHAGHAMHGAAHDPHAGHAQHAPADKPASHDGHEHHQHTQ